MIVLGRLFLVVVAAVTVVAVARGGDPVSFKVGSLSFETDGTGMFLAGAASLLLAVVGLWLLRRGMARSRQRRQEMRELRDRASRNEEAARRERSVAAEQTSGDGETVATTRTDDTEVGRHVDADDHFDTAPRERS
jgi:ABC-type nickel/cobalt efflux system permease component RcnA